MCLHTASQRSTTSGYNGRRFPVLVGEVGSAFETPTDKQWLQDFADFANAEVRVMTGPWRDGVAPGMAVHAPRPRTHP
jgi:hypothetical protein